MSGYGISQADMEASRLVFVSVKDAKPRRKVAVPVPDGASWEQFCSQVQTKLKLLGVGAIYLASSGEQVLRVDDLQDIDELFVVESKPAPVVSAAAAAQGGNGASGPGSYSRQQSGAGASTSGQQGGPPLSPSFRSPSDGRHRVGVADAEIRPLEMEDEGDSDAKYVKRNTSLQRSLKRVFPSLFQPGLPVTSRDAKEGGSSTGVQGRRRRRARRLISPRNLVFTFALLSCLGTLIYIYSRLAPKLP